MNTEQKQALQAFVHSVRLYYGARLADVFVFGSQARGDATDDSDTDVVIVIADGAWQFWTELRWLSDKAYDALIETGLNIHAWPVERSAWERPEAHSNPRLIANMRRDAQRVEVLT
jgi:uncharacterized protein